MTQTRTPLFPLAHLQQDCLRVLADVQKRWRVPAEALYQAIAQQGWRLRRGPLPKGSFCCCDAWEQTLIVSDNFTQELTSPALHQRVLHWVLAAKLGLIRLHSMDLLDGRNRPAFAHTGTEYAMAFLLPQSMLQAHPDVAYLVQGQPGKIEGWRRLCRVASISWCPRPASKVRSARSVPVSNRLPSRSVTQ